jgi:hypothetical protein
MYAREDGEFPHIDDIIDAIKALQMMEGKFSFGSYEISIGHGGVVGIRRLKEGTN